MPGRRTNRPANIAFDGPAAAAALGAAAALVRSIGGADYRLPHTGATIWKDKQAPIPAAALAAEDADLIVRLAARGPVSMNLLLTPQTLPDADSFNVIADWPGRELPKEYVVVSGHLDSWDLAHGRHGRRHRRHGRGRSHPGAAAAEPASAPHHPLHRLDQ